MVTSKCPDRRQSHSRAQSRRSHRAEARGERRAESSSPAQSRNRNRTRRNQIKRGITAKQAGYTFDGISQTRLSNAQESIQDSKPHHTSERYPESQAKKKVYKGVNLGSFPHKALELYDQVAR